jgi:tRNA uridine 5-carbamoylmethylation protein Kti12
MNERRHVQVIIAGYPGSGKTAVATLLRDALSAHGHDDVEIMDMSLDDDDPTPDIVEQRLMAMKDNGHTIGIQVRTLLTPISGMGK